MGTITLKNVRKAFGDAVIIPGADLDIGHGEFVVFVGPSGCGKSTLLRLIAGLEDLTSGEIRIDGQNVTDVPPSKRGLVHGLPVLCALSAHERARQHRLRARRWSGIPKDEIDAKVAKAAATLNLTEYSRPPAARSSPAASASASPSAAPSSAQPKVFLFDEPLSNLDADLRVEHAGRDRAAPPRSRHHHDLCDA